MQCECVAFSSKEYIFMKDKAPWRWSVYTALYNERGLNVFDWPGISAYLTPIEEVWKIMKKKYIKLPNNKKKTLE